MELLSQAMTFLSDWVNKYFPIYIDWLTLQLKGQSSFGLLSLVGSLTMFFALVYVFVRSER
jgi:hypothetical protein